MILLDGSDNKTVGGIRTDKWLWAARFFKSRSLAARACELGRIEAGGQRSKPSREIRIGDLLQVKTERDHFEVEVLALSEIRGPATVAQTLYRETDESKESRLKLAEERKAALRSQLRPSSKPSKRDRRELARMRGRS